MAEELTLEGTRKIGGIPYARISHLSGYRVSEQRAKSQKALANWRKNFAIEHPDLPEDFYSQRGTKLHSAIEHYIMTQTEPPELHPWIEPFWPHARRIASKLSTHYWIEKPILDPPMKGWPPNLAFTDNEGQTRFHVWSDNGFCGTPDHIGRYRGKVTLTDWKSSKVPYQTQMRFGSKAKVNGYYKFRRTCLQLGAYIHAVEERLGVKDFIQQGHICTFVQPDLKRPNDNVQCQSLIIPRVDLEKAYQDFLVNLELWKQENGDFLSGKVPGRIAPATL